MCKWCKCSCGCGKLCKPRPSTSTTVLKAKIIVWWGAKITTKNILELRYPKAVYFIVVCEFCERFSFYGMRAILSLYLRNILLYPENEAKVIYHSFAMLCYFFPLLGAIISDSCLGKFNTIFYISMIYASGNILLSLSSADPIGLPQVTFSLIGLLLIAIGTGGIKPCVSSFGGDQFILPQQQHHLDTFFSAFYFAINAGSLSSTLITPSLRKGVRCFGKTSCYSLAFGIPGVLMIIAIIIFISGKPLYKINKPEGNMVVQVSNVIGRAIKKKAKAHDKVDHWLDRAEEKYGQQLVNDVKITLRVLVLFLPLPLFWTLFDQQGSAWTFQATRMDGRIGSYTILPDHMQVANPLLILIFIPLFNYGIYPALAKCNLLVKPLQRIVCGGLVTALSFGISAGIAFTLEATYPVLPANGECQIRIYNPLTCNAIITAKPYVNNQTVKAMGYTFLDIKNVKGANSVKFSILGCDQISYKTGSDFNVTEKKAFLYYMLDDKLVQIEDDIDKDDRGLPKIRTLVNKPKKGLNVSYWSAGNEDEEDLSVASSDYSMKTIPPGVYTVGKLNKKLEFFLGGVYTVLVSFDDNNNTKRVENYEITAPNSLHMLWLIPQYVVITAAEIMVSITGLEFSYSQAPISMKAVLTAAWLLTTAFGNLITVIIESANIFKRQSANLLLYCGLMVVDMILFAFLARRYNKYAYKPESSEGEEHGNKPEGKEN